MISIFQQIFQNPSSSTSNLIIICLEIAQKMKKCKNFKYIWHSLLIKQKVKYTKMADVLEDCPIQNFKQSKQNKQESKPIDQIKCPAYKLLPPNDQIYISSIVSTTFEGDNMLILLQNQTQDVTKMRSQLMESYLKLSAHQYVFFSAFFYLQNFLNKMGRQYKYNKDLAIACLALARKYQKGASPNLINWKQKLGIDFKKQQVQILQDEIIQVLEFQLEAVTRLKFMTDLFLKVDLQQKIHNFCYYLLDLSVFLGRAKPLQGQQMMQFSEGEIGLSVVRLACYFFNPDELERLPVLELGYNMQRIHQCCSLLFQLLMNRKLPQLKSIRHKYKKPKFMEVARIQFFKIKKVGSEKERETADEDEKELQRINQ